MANLIFNEKSSKGNTYTPIHIEKFTDSKEFVAIINDNFKSARQLSDLKRELLKVTDKDIMNMFIRDSRDSRSLFTNSALGSSLRVGKDNVLAAVRNSHLISVKSSELFKKDNFCHYNLDAESTISLSSRAIKVMAMSDKRSVKTQFNAQDFNTVTGILETLVIQGDDMGRIYSVFTIDRAAKELTIISSFQINREELKFVALADEFVELISAVSYTGADIDLSNFFNQTTEKVAREELSNEVSNAFGLTK